MQRFVPAALVLGLLACASARAQEGVPTVTPLPATSVRWLGHSAFELVTAGGKTLLIDPWITQNPRSPVKLEEIARADLILVTHDHQDHLGDAVAIANKTGAVIVAPFELTQRLLKEGVAADRLLSGGFGMNYGGTARFGMLSITMVPAVHTGNPCGYVIGLEDGRALYHAGDTALFGDLALIAERYHPQIALLPIGDTFTMGAVDAARAVRLLGARVVIPMHFGTFPILAKDAGAFVEETAKQAPTARVVVLKPGDGYLL